MKKSMRSFLMSVCVCLSLVMVILPAQARAEYPERLITMYVSYAAGGPIDMTTRTITPLAEKILGQRIVVENKPGGGGTVALALLANTKPDGYTLCGATHGGIVRQPQAQKMTFKPLKSFTPLIAYAAVQNSIAVKKEAPWNTLRDLVAYAKKNPNKIKYSTGGVGTGMHHAMVVIEYKEGIKWIHVPYKGNADAMTALMGGHVDVCSGGPEVYPLERAGVLKILAIAETKKNPRYPNVPTMKELGYDFANDSFFNIIAPAGLPSDIAGKLESAFAKAAESKEMTALIDRLDMLPVLYVGKEYDDLIKSTWFETEKSLKETGLVKESATSPY